ncbi:PaaX family transcriptional regulator C-terminal domain-containing protein [Nocardia takedensis]|uniref:PaaX family transcriptional regulator C-terminal domain-containing protein n=1 Tax=Nocardia takedensis TaxID=259390 RepID=UPI003F75C93B
MSAAEHTEIATRTLVESLIRRDGSVDCGELYELAPLFAMTDQQVRLCVKRLVGEGHFVQEGRGRKAVLRATRQTRAVIGPDRDFLRYMYAQDRGDIAWDGRWRLIGFAVPESDRRTRDVLREAVLRLGGAAIQGGLYVCANPWERRIRSAVAASDAARYVTTCTTTDLVVGGIEEPRALAAHLWPLARIAEGHRRLLAAAERFRAELPEASRIQRTRITVALAAEFSRAVDPDPLLPPELLPRPWVGAAARAATAACWAELAARDPDRSTDLFRWYAEAIPALPG